MKITIPKDIEKELDSLRSFFHKSKSEMVKEALINYVITSKEIKFEMEKNEL